MSLNNEETFGQDEISNLKDRADLETLFRLSNVLSSITELQTLLENLVELAIENLNAERGVAFLIDKAGGLYPTAARSLYPEDIVDAHKIALTVVKEVVKGKNEFLSANVSEDTTIHSESAVFFNILSVLCVPIIYQETVLGALYLDHGKKAGAFSERDSNFLKAFIKLSAPLIYHIIEKESLTVSSSIVEEQRFEKNYPEIITNSQQMIQIFETLDLIAPSNVSVLILGESGTGKELIARAIHSKSTRREKRFIVQNCASIPETLLESELFGYRKGAYTGATHDKPGLFEVADGGTLFLDEIGDLSLSSQAKILRALQDGEIRRIGDNTPIKVDVRIISATNKDLQDQIFKGLFREDLFYRLNIVTIKVPPLRERKEDIPLLARHFLSTYCQKFGKHYAGIEQGVVELLTNYNWPGNVRQLKNEMERIAILLKEGEIVTPSKISEVIHQNVLMKPSSDSKTLKDVLDQIQERMVIETLSKHKWNKTKAAEELGITRRGLLKMIERMGLDRRKKKR
jgi:Nif-specific regulatory protein